MVSIRKNFAKNNGANLGFEKKLAATRDALPPKLISGEIRIPHTEKFMDDN